jgi:hypothetical protein
MDRRAFLKGLLASTVAPALLPILPASAGVPYGIGPITATEVLQLQQAFNRRVAAHLGAFGVAIIHQTAERGMELLEPSRYLRSAA